MANWNFLVQDGVTGKPITNATISGYVNTTPCPGWPNTGSCTTGSGYPINIVNSNGTTNPNSYDATIPYSCVQNISVSVSAPGYGTVADAWQTGTITGDVGNTFTLYPLSTTTGQQQELNNGGVVNTSALVNWWATNAQNASNSAIIILAIIAVIVVAVVVVLVVVVA
jgi:hypothetical protein